MDSETTSERENRYVKADLLDYADISQVDDDSDSRFGTSHSRSDLLKMALGLDSYEYEVVTAGSYQGSMCWLFEAGGYVWILKDSFGSCSHCDGLLAADHISEYAESMLRDAYAFESYTDAREFLEYRADPPDDVFTGWSWRDLASLALEHFENLQGGTA